MADTLQSLQYQFAAHIRDPKHQPAPADVEDRRMKIYRDLFYNNINKFLSNNFPVVRQMYSETDWRRVVREFYSEHLCHTPLFPELPKEFLRYVQEQRIDRAGDPPFLLELAHYEWIELALALDEHELERLPVDQESDLLQGVPILSPLAWQLTYLYPVHRIGPDNMPTEPPADATHLLAYRNRLDQVKFMQLNGVTQLLLNLLRESNDQSGLELLSQLAEQLQHPNPDRLVENGHQLLRDFLEKDIVLGCRPA